MSRHGTYDPVYGFLPEDDFPEEQKPQSNADRLRSMSDEELAEWFDLHASEPLWCDLPVCPDHGECVKCILKWLKAPADPGEGEG